MKDKDKIILPKNIKNNSIKLPNFKKGEDEEKHDKIILPNYKKDEEKQQATIKIPKVKEDEKQDCEDKLSKYPKNTEIEEFKIPNIKRKKEVTEENQKIELRKSENNNQEKIILPDHKKVGGKQQSTIKIPKVKEDNNYKNDEDKIEIPKFKRSDDLNGFKIPNINNEKKITEDSNQKIKLQKSKQENNNKIRLHKYKEDEYKKSTYTNQNYKTYNPKTTLWSLIKENISYLIVLYGVGILLYILFGGGYFMRFIEHFILYIPVVGDVMLMPWYALLCLLLYPCGFAVAYAIKLPVSGIFTFLWLAIDFYFSFYLSPILAIFIIPYFIFEAQKKIS